MKYTKELYNTIDKKQSYDYELIAQSYHESGHTVCALISYMKVFSVAVMNDRDNGDGKTEYAFTDPAALTDKRLIEVQLYFELETAYAGLLAEKIYYKDICGSEQFPLHLKKGSSGDIADAHNLIKKYKLASPGIARTQFKKKIQKDTHILLLENWSDIKLVAHFLHKRKKLQFDDLKFILTRKSENKESWKERFRVIKMLNDKPLMESEIIKIFEKAKII